MSKLKLLLKVLDHPKQTLKLMYIKEKTVKHVLSDFSKIDKTNI